MRKNQRAVLACIDNSARSHHYDPEKTCFCERDRFSPAQFDFARAHRTRIYPYLLRFPLVFSVYPTNSSLGLSSSCVGETTLSMSITPSIAQSDRRGCHL